MKVKYFNSLGGIAAIAVLSCGCASSALQQPAKDRRFEPPIVVAKNIEIPVILQEAPLRSEILPITYDVRKGDSLSLIATRYNIRVNDLMAWNGISNPNKLRVGQKLALSSNNALSSAPAAVTKKKLRTLSGDSYTIQQGDTLSEVASAFKTTVPALKQINNLQSDTIHVGKRLVISKPAETTKATIPDMVAEPAADTNAVSASAASANVQEPGAAAIQ